MPRNAERPQCWKRPKTGTHGKAACGAIAGAHAPQKFRGAAAALSPSAAGSWAALSLDATRRASPYAPTSSKLQSSKNCLLTFWSIYMHLQTGEGKGKGRGRCQFTGLCVCFFFFVSQRYPPFGWQESLATHVILTSTGRQHNTPPVNCKVLP